MSHIPRTLFSMPTLDSATLQALSTFPGQLEAHYAAFPAGLRHWVPTLWEGIPSEHLTAIEQLCHVRDIEIDGYQARFRRTLEEDKPFLGSLDTYGLARERDYGKADAHKVMAEFRAARERTLKLLAGLSTEQLARPAEFEGYGPVTLKGLVHYLCSHDQQHLSGLQWLLGKIEAA